MRFWEPQNRDSVAALYYGNRTYFAATHTTRYHGNYSGGRCWWQQWSQMNHFMRTIPSHSMMFLQYIPIECFPFSSCTDAHLTTQAPVGTMHLLAQFLCVRPVSACTETAVVTRWVVWYGVEDRQTTLDNQVLKSPHLEGSGVLRTIIQVGIPFTMYCMTH